MAAEFTGEGKSFNFQFENYDKSYPRIFEGTIFEVYSKQEGGDFRYGVIIWDDNGDLWLIRTQYDPSKTGIIFFDTLAKAYEFVNKIAG